MRLIQSSSRDVYFNLAAEDCLLNHTRDNVVMLWQSDAAVVCGKHQNLCAEVNYAFCKQNNISLARRLSGGGTVYHDVGNVNFTFIQNLEDHEELNINFKRFLDPVIAVLGSMGVKATYSGRNDLLVDGFKISGNAEHLHQQRRRVLHHGTLLFNSKLDSLGKALHSVGEYESKAVKSVRSKVMNIQHLTPFKSTESFIEALAAGFIQHLGANISFLNDEELHIIQELRQQKYATTSWIQGYSPVYTAKKELLFNNKPVVIGLRVNKGIIEDFQIHLGHDNALEQALKDITGKELSEDTEEHFFQSLGIDYTPELQYSLF